MSAAEAWTGGAAGALAVLVCVYLTLLLRALRNEQIISTAIRAMREALAGEPASQRVLLSAVADTLMAQERATGRIEVAIHELALHGYQVPEPEELLTELLALPEPQLLVTDFLKEHGSDPGSTAPFSSMAADLVRTAAVAAFRDLASEGAGKRLIHLERLLLLAADGRIGPVALAGLVAPLNPIPPPYRAPRLADTDPVAVAAIARGLDGMIRRYLRLATLLHGQAEAILRVRRDAKQPRLAVLRARVLEFVRYPPPRRPDIRPEDLTALETAFDAIGEAVDTAEERLAEGEPARAIYLLAGLRVPVPAGLPGRMYHQDSLAQVRPLAAFGVLHRLAVSRWAAASLQAIAQHGTEPEALAWRLDRDSSAEGQ